MKNSSQNNWMEEGEHDDDDDVGIENKEKF